MDLQSHNIYAKIICEMNGFFWGPLHRRKMLSKLSDQTQKIRQIRMLRIIAKD